MFFKRFHAFFFPFFSKNHETQLSLPKIFPRIIANRSDSSVQHQDDEDAAPEEEAGQVAVALEQ